MKISLVLFATTTATVIFSTVNGLEKEKMPPMQNSYHSQAPDAPPMNNYNNDIVDHPHPPPPHHPHPNPECMRLIKETCKKCFREEDEMYATSSAEPWDHKKPDFKCMHECFEKNQDKLEKCRPQKPSKECIEKFHSTCPKCFRHEGESEDVATAQATTENNAVDGEIPPQDQSFDHLRPDFDCMHKCIHENYRTLKDCLPHHHHGEEGAANDENMEGYPYGDDQMFVRPPRYHHPAIAGLFLFAIIAISYSVGRFGCCFLCKRIGLGKKCNRKCRCNEQDPTKNNIVEDATPIRIAPQTSDEVKVYHELLNAPKQEV